MRLLAAALVLFAASASAQAPAPSPTPVPPPKVEAKIADAAWLQGYWVGEGMGGTCEDMWMPPANGVMLGAFRITKSDGSKGFHQVMGIEEFEGSLRLVVKHFHPDWVGWEEKDQSLKLRLTKVGDGELVFGGVAFQRTEPDTFAFRITMRQREGPPKVDTVAFRKKTL